MNSFSSKKDFVDFLFTSACRKFGCPDKEIASLITKLQSEDPTHVCIKYSYSILNNPEGNSLIAGACLMYGMYMSSPLTIKEYAEIFRNDLEEKVYDYMMTHNELQDYIHYERDFFMHIFSVRTAIASYLSRLKYDEEPVEIPQMTWMRVAVGQFHSHFNARDEIANTYAMYSTNMGIAASPTIFNMGFKRGATLSCAIYTIADDLEDIYSVLKEMALASKNNAGIGVDLSSLRHSDIGRHGISSGIIRFCKLIDDSTAYVNQGGRREGATTLSLRDCHFDFPEFIRLVDKIGEEENRVKKCDISLMMSDLFFKRLKIPNSTWTLFCPKQTKKLFDLWGEEFEKEYARYEQLAETWKDYSKYLILKKSSSLTKGNKALFTALSARFGNLTKDQIPEKIVCRQFKTQALMDEITLIQTKFSKGYIAHGCNINRKNAMQNQGPVRGLNLCQEINIPAVAREQTGCCTLASIALDKFAVAPTYDSKGMPEKEARFDYSLFSQIVRQQIRCLNAVIDNMHNVSDKVRKSNDLSRPIGLGVNGFGDMCNIMRIPVTDPNKLPHVVGQEEDGSPIFEFASWKECMPDYSQEGLLERELNPVLSDLNWKIWCCMYYNALKESCEEAKRFGYYKSFPTSQTAQGRLQYHLWQEEEKITGRKYNFSLTPLEPETWGQTGTWEELIAEIRKYGLRNALLLTCMPTASSASLLNTTESTEFHKENIYIRKVSSGDYIVMNYHCYRELKKLGLWNKATYDIIQQSKGSILGIPETDLSENQKIELRYLKEMFLIMFEIRPKIMIDLALQRQVVIDHTQSMNIYIRNPTQQQLQHIHCYTNEQGAKTGMYYLRSVAATEPLELKEKNKKVFVGEVHDAELIAFVQEEKNEIETANIEKKKIIQKLITESADTDLPMVCRKDDPTCISCQ